MSIIQDNLTNQKGIDRLKNRWTRDIINLIVVALNEGRPISDIIEQISPKDSSVREDCLDMRGIDLSHQNLRGPWITKEMRRSRCGINLKNVDMKQLEHGKISAMAGNAAFEYVKRVIKLALDKKIDATVTGPIHKESKFTTFFLNLMTLIFHYQFE